MDTYNPNKLTAASKKVDISLRQLADFDQTGGDRDRVDNVRDNQVLVSLSKFNRPKTFSFRYISDLLIGGTGITISTDKDGITTISASAASGDMTKAVYDTDNDGVVDNSEAVKIIVRNSTGVTLTKGQVVYLFGATGNRPNAVLASATTEATSSKTIGLVSADILNNADGYITISGTMHDLALNMFAAGDRLWLGTTPGGMVANTPPSEPNHAVFIGTVARAHPTQGRLVLAIQNGYELTELHGVEITTPTDGEALTYNAASGLWKNTDIEAIMIAYSIAL